MKKQIERIAALETMIPAIHETLQGLDRKMDGLDHVIRGNGSPGLTARLGSLEEVVKSNKEIHSMARASFYSAVSGLVVGIVIFLCQIFWSNAHGTITKAVPEMQQESSHH